MRPLFKYTSAQMIALRNDPTIDPAERRTALEALMGPHPKPGTPREKYSSIRGCLPVASLTTDDLKEELAEIREASRVAVPPKLTPTGRLSKKQGPAYRVQSGSIGSVRSGEILDELRLRGPWPDILRTGTVAKP